MLLGEARVPEGLRIYAIGDVHGCDDLLTVVHAMIAEDLEAHPSESARIIHLGDYVDRGPDTAAVVERLSRLCEADERIVCLRGNHEEMVLDFLAQPLTGSEIWLANGGDATLSSYGIALPSGDEDDWRTTKLSDEFAAALPAHHHRFLASLGYSAQFGDYFFCHAGIRPGIPLAEQDPHDLTWIREGFLDNDADFGVVVVHGHTVTKMPEIRPNRIDFDTGVVRYGKLTCLILEGNRQRFL